MVDSVARTIDQHDLIVARSTAAGPGAIAIVRVDGAGAADLVAKLFRPIGKTSPIETPRTAVLGRWIDPAAASDDTGIDEGITLFFKGPHSFTGNDLAEFHCHGGPAVVRGLIEAALERGARPAEPGEFTRRAFLNGRLDLAQAEAVADLIAAQTGASARLATRQLAGGLSREIEVIRKKLIELAAEIEARIDFPDEGIEAADRTRLTQLFDGVAAKIARLAESSGRGRLLREGARVALAGPPNVGKSSLLNALARSERAIVTPHAGTTRDTIECTIDLDGIAVTLIDTAGLRESSEPIERIGIERAREAIGEADLILDIRDAAGEIAPMELGEADAAGRRLIVHNKIDLIPAGRPRPQPSGSLREDEACVSAKSGEGIEALERKIEAALAGEAGAAKLETAADTVAVSQRHAALLGRAQTALGEARAGWDQALGGELTMIDLREALAQLDEILGLAPSEAILDRIFERFCLGK